jgi:hypothetical protein
MFREIGEGAVLKGGKTGGTPGPAHPSWCDPLPHPLAWFMHTLANNTAKLCIYYAKFIGIVYAMVLTTSIPIGTVYAITPTMAYTAL